MNLMELDDAMFSTLDWILIIILILTGIWWVFIRRKPDPEPKYVQKKFSIHPTPDFLEGSIDNSFIKKLKSSGRSLVVFYGSQTGTAEEFASRLAKEGIRYKMKGMVADPEECEMEELTSLNTIPKSMAVFCLATYGEGDPTDNAMEFVEWLKNGNPNLSDLKYAVFGLGNKTYEHYNEIAIYVDQRLEELGAIRVVPLGLGDDDANIEDDFITWKDKFWPTVCDYFGFEITGEDISIRQYKLTEHQNIDNEKVFIGEMSRLNSLITQRPPFDAKNPFLAKIIVNKELHKGGNRSCMHIELNIEGCKTRYESGDHVAIFPTNDIELVKKLGQLTKTNLDTIITLTNTDEESSKKHPFPCPCSYRTALTHYLDITMNPRTHILKELAEYCSDSRDKEMLKLMSSTKPEGKSLYLKWIIENKRNIVHVLEDLPSCSPPLDHICELLPRLQPRFYSISSSPKLYPNTIHVTAVLVKYQTPTGRLNKGVATCWLAENVPNNNKDYPKVPIFIRKSQFRLPTKSNVPIIMIGPGTGLAPFRGFLQERSLAKQQNKIVGENILYFGCRKKNDDFIYEDELEQFVNNGDVKLYTAFSRDQEHKVYVTHLLEKNTDELWDVIGPKNGHIYICGDAKSMAIDVRNIIIKAVKEKNNWTNQQAQDFIKRMEIQRRYSADVWS